MPRASVGAHSTQAPATGDGRILKPEDFVWSDHPFNGGEAENEAVLGSFEQEYRELVKGAAGDLRADDLLRATLDLAGAYVKNYALDKADLLYSQVLDECRSRGMPWDVKCLQDLATLRFKQNRQPECAELLEELARRAPPHPATYENLGTVYNSLGDHAQALEHFEKAVEMKGGTPAKEDLWNLALARKNLGEPDAAIPMLEVALQRFADECPEEPVTIAKVHDSLADCYFTAGMSARAAEEYRHATELYAAHVGERSPLYAGAADGLSRTLQAANRPGEAFDAIVKALEAQGHMDGIHPTPVYELLDRALELCERPEAPGGEDGGEIDPREPEGQDSDPRLDLRRLLFGLNAGLENLGRRGLDADGNGGVVLHKAAQVLLEAAEAESHDGHKRAAADLWRRAAGLFGRARELMREATEAGEADLSELCAIAALQSGLAEARLADTCGSGR